MTEEPIRPSEEEILVFISSRQDEEMAEARALAIEAVDAYPGVRVWAFEDAPASSEAARDRYIRNAGRAEIVIWLIGSTTKPPIVEEIDACLRSGSKLLLFKLPAHQRDPKTRELIDRVQKEVTWRTVESVKKLPEQIHTALTDEIVRGYRDPAPIGHDQYLRHKLRASVADTKRLWTTLGVPDDISEELAENRSIGHKLEPPTSGVLMVKAAQGAGKTLAAHRLYQQTVDSRILDHFQPLPILLNARTIKGDLKNHIEDEIGDQGSVYNQPALVIIDGLDEVGRYKANLILGQSTSFTDANRNVSAVVMTRSIPGLKDVGVSAALPECSGDEFLGITSKIAGRSVNDFEIPYRIFKARSPLFAVIVGTHLRNIGSSLGTTPSQMVNLLVRRILEESDDYPEETAELLKKLAAATITSGESVPKATVDLRPEAQARISNSRLVVEQNDKLDFEIAMFREWFAARALAEGTISPSEIDLTSDRWVVPIAIAINSENAILASEIMAILSTNDPGLTGLVMEEVKHNWSTEDPPETLPPGTAVELGHRIREAMSNWKEGLGPLISAIGPTAHDGTMPPLMVDKAPPLVTTSWYQGEEQLGPVVEKPEDLDPSSPQTRRDWPIWRSEEIEPTRIWPWTTTKEELSESLSEQFITHRFALDSVVGLQELTAEFAKAVPNSILSTPESPKIKELIDFFNVSTTGLEDSPPNIVEPLTLGRMALTNLSRAGYDTISDPWPGPDKPLPEGRNRVRWDEVYTDQQLLERAKAIFYGALRIYNDIVEQWFPAFNRRHQMASMFPLRLEGILVRGGNPNRPEWHRVSLMWWPRVVSSHNESDVLFELGSWDQIMGDAKNDKLQAAQEEFLDKRGKFRYSTQVFRGNEPRPATKIAHAWLTSDLQDLGWWPDGSKMLARRLKDHLNQSQGETRRVIE